VTAFAQAGVILWLVQAAKPLPSRSHLKESGAKPPEPLKVKVAASLLMGSDGWPVMDVSGVVTLVRLNATLVLPLALAVML